MNIARPSLQQCGKSSNNKLVWNSRTQVWSCAHWVSILQPRLTSGCCSVPVSPYLLAGQDRNIYLMALRVPITSSLLPLPKWAALFALSCIGTKIHTQTGADCLYPTSNTACHFFLCWQNVSYVIVSPGYFLHLFLIHLLLSQLLLDPFSIPFSKLQANIKQVLLF